MPRLKNALPRMPPTILAAAALGLLTTISGCATTEGRIISAAEVKGKAEAKTTIADLPPECRKHMERVSPQAGDKARWLQARWEANADAIDHQVDDCAAFHDDFKTRMESRHG